MQRQINWLAKFQLFLEMHWVKILIALILIASLIWPVFAISKLDSYQKTYVMALFSMGPVQSIMYGGFFVAMLYWLHYGGGSFGKMNRGKVQSKHVNIRWDEVIGMEEAKMEAWEVVELLRDHAKVKRIGGKVLRGILLLGPPGCGKTYLAKAIATETGLPFMAVSGSEFVEVFVGTGPARVRKLFEKAQRFARTDGGCIIFIDELDAVGSSRGNDLGFGAQTEHNNTVNELLVQMDGLESARYNIIVIGATNADESVLDSALLRPGRMDRKIHIDKPGLEDREKLYEFYLKKVKTDPKLNIPRIARRSVWKSPAEIENIVKEAALIATRNKNEFVTSKDISEALDRIELGSKRRRKMNEEERRATAYHESGHAIVTYLLHPTDDVFKASILARGDTLGVVFAQPREELFSWNRDRLLAQIRTFLGGYVAEKLKCQSTTSGVASDFRNAMQMAHSMVWKYGMGGNGFIGDYEVLLSSSQFRGAGTGDRLSDRMKDRLNEETHKILRTCIDDVEALLKKEDVLLERFAEVLLEKEELDYDEIEAIFDEFGKKRVTPASSSSPSKPTEPSNG